VITAVLTLIAVLLTLLGFGAAQVAEEENSHKTATAALLILVCALIFAFGAGWSAA
jgi:hypothetical protein